MEINQDTVTVKTINVKRLAVFAIIAVLLAANILWAISYFSMKKEVAVVSQETKTNEINEKVLNFTDLFISKVLQAQTEISFEDRLQFENGVRDLQSPELLDQWNKFVNSKDPVEAQKEVKDFLQMLVKDIRVK